MGYIYLFIAIIGELIGTNLLKASAGFTKLYASIGFIIAYGICFYFLSLAMKYINLNVVYALWAGLGIVLTTIFAVFFWHESINILTIVGTTLIVIGAIVLQFSTK